MKDIIDRKTLHEKMDDRLIYRLVQLGAHYLAAGVIEEIYRTYDTFEDYCGQAINRYLIPDDMTFNEVVMILKPILEENYERSKGK